MVSLEVIALVLTGLSITASIVYYANVLSNANKTQKMQLETRQAQLLMKLYEEWRNPEQLKLYAKSLQMNWTSYEDFQDKYSVDNFEERLPFTAMSYYWEGVGVLVEEGLIDIKLVSKLFSGDLKTHWEKFRSYIYDARERRNYPQFFDKTEYLYNRIEGLRGFEWIEKTITDITKE